MRRGEAGESGGAHRGVLQRLHFSRKAKLMLPQLVHFQSPGADPGPEDCCITGTLCCMK